MDNENELKYRIISNTTGKVLDENLTYDQATIKSFGYAVQLLKPEIQRDVFNEIANIVKPKNKK